jgi:hypothetical protein
VIEAGHFLKPMRETRRAPIFFLFTKYLPKRRTLVMRGALHCLCATYGGTTTVKPYNPVLRSMTVFALLGASGPLAADG